MHQPKVVSGDGRFVRVMVDPSEAPAFQQLRSLISPTTVRGTDTEGDRRSSSPSDASTGRGFISPSTRRGTNMEGDGDEPLPASPAVLAGFISPTTLHGSATDGPPAPFQKSLSYMDALARSSSGLFGSDPELSVLDERPESTFSSSSRPPISVTHFVNPLDGTHGYEQHNSSMRSAASITSAQNPHNRGNALLMRNFSADSGPSRSVSRSPSSQLYDFASPVAKSPVKSPVKSPTVDVDMGLGAWDIVAMEHAAQQSSSPHQTSPLPSSQATLHLSPVPSHQHIDDANASDPYIDILSNLDDMNQPSSMQAHRSPLSPQQQMLLESSRSGDAPEHWNDFDKSKAKDNLEKRVRRRSVEGGLLGAISNPTGYIIAVLVLFAFAVSLLVMGVSLALEDDTDGNSLTDLGLYMGVPFIVFGAAFFIATSMSVYSYLKSDTSTLCMGGMSSYKDFDVNPSKFTY